MTSEQKATLLAMLSLTLTDSMPGIKETYKKYTGIELDEEYLQVAIQELRKQETIL